MRSMRSMRSMRRKQKDVTDSAAPAELLARAAVCRLGFSAAEGLCDYPYVVPLHFAHRDGTIYVHCATEGLKLDLLRRDERVCVEVDEMGGIVPGPEPCAFDSRFTSVIGFGRARLVTDPAGKREALDLITRKHAGPGRPPPQWTDKQLASVAVIAVVVEHLTAKRSGRA